MQRSVRENIALPFVTAGPPVGPASTSREERKTAWTARSQTLQIDTRAGGEVRRLSGGNQQKVTIARWVAGGVRTMLCFDPTRGIDIRHQAPDLSCCSATSPRPAPPSCSTPPSSRRSSSSATGRSSSSAAASFARSPAPRPTSRRCCGPRTTCGRAAHARGGGRRGDRRGGASGRRALLAARSPSRNDPTSDRGASGERRGGARRRRTRDGQPARGGPARRNAWTIGLIAIVIGLLLFTKGIQPRYGPIPDPGPRDLGPAARPGGRRPGDRRHRRRHRPLDRLDDGADQRRLGHPDEGPERGVRRRRRRRRAAPRACCSASSTAGWSS